MNNNANDAETRLSIIAIAQEENRLKAVRIRKRADAFEVLWTKSSDGSDASWQPFATECGLSIGPPGQTKTGDDKASVVGFSSAGVAFYHINLPVAKGDEIAAMVSLQAETLLPLPPEQMELTWRAGQVQDGKVAVTIAAARRDYLQGFVENVRALNPTKILLDCEGVVKAWKELFSKGEKDAVVVSFAARSTQVCLAEDRRLSNAVVLDMGTDDFLEDAADEGEPEPTESTERFVQDIKSALESFGCAQTTELPIFVLSNGSSVIEAIVSCLKSAGLNARAALPQIQKVRAQRGFGVEQLYEYRVPIGLALIALETPADGLSLFERLYRPAGTEKKRPGLYSPKIAGAIAAVMLAVFVIVSYAIDVASPRAIEKRLQTADSSADIDLLMERQKLIKAVALERPNLLELLNLVTESGDRGIKLESFHFKKGQLVTITGQAPGNEQLYRFEESLQDRKNIKDVKITSTADIRGASDARGTRGGSGTRPARGAGGARGRGIKFTITFHYKNFTKKRTRT